MSRQSAKARKAARSAAAKRGWETRHANAVARRWVSYGAPASDGIAAGQRAINVAMGERLRDPNPWPRRAGMIKRWWARVLEFLRS